jgi:hydrogenase expression/formation protein HypE
MAAGTIFIGMVGKLSPEDLESVVFPRTGADSSSVQVGPAYAEDAAAIDIGEQMAVVSTDPISLASERIGTLGVNVACNDVAASGGTPRWLTNTIFLPDDDTETLETITADVDSEAERLGVSIVGGHTEYLPALSQPLLSLTCMGLADRFVPTAGAQPGDRLILTKGAGIEGTAVIASDFRADLDQPEDRLDRAATFFDDLSVVPDAQIVSPYATSMHDPTEGGVVTGLVELARASGVSLSVESSAVPIREATREVCGAMDVDPLSVLGSGALLATVPDDDCESVVAELADAGIDANPIGRVRESDDPALDLDGTTIRTPVRDEIYGLWE